MAIRLRVVDGVLIATCAARSVEKPGDVYLDDAAHEALADKFARDWSESGVLNLPGVTGDLYTYLVEQEESNNPNRTWWDETYGENKCL